VAKTKPTKKRPADVNELAHFLGKQSTGEDGTREPDASEISRVMAALGRRGGKIGGKRRLETLTQEQRSQIAYRAAQARWSKTKKPD
jgi:hypothetical protein